MKRIEILESFKYKGFNVQRLGQDHHWYAVRDNIIHDRDRYQNDIKERIDILIKTEENETTQNL